MAVRDLTVAVQDVPEAARDCTTTARDCTMAARNCTTTLRGVPTAMSSATMAERRIAASIIKSADRGAGHHHNRFTRLRARVKDAPPGAVFFARPFSF